MKKTKTQRDYQRQMQSHYKSTGIKQEKPKFNLFRNAFTRSKFFYYGIRILLILVILGLANNIDALFYSFFQ